MVPFGSISDQLAAVGSTIQPNCSFSILCLFSDCQNTRMCNQGWARNEARQISQHRSQTIITVWVIVWCHWGLFPLVWSLKMEESVTLNWRRYASDDSVSALIITHYLLSVNLICVWVQSILFDLSWVGLRWVDSNYLILSSPIFLTTKLPPLPISVNYNQLGKIYHALHCSKSNYVSTDEALKSVVFTVKSCP